jgi:Ice-binding-like/Bacterial Ig-like domain
MNMKPKKLLTTLAIVSVVLWAGCKKDTFVGTIGVCPKVVSTYPLDKSTNIPLKILLPEPTKVTATFNEKMDPLTITNASFTVTGATQVAGTVSYTDTTATFVPSNALTANTTYTAKITTAVKDLKGNALQANYVWTFSTGAVLSPTVISTNPADSAVNVVLNKIITARFSGPMDSLTLTTTTFTLKQGATVISGTVSYNDTVATFTPSANLLPGSIYTATITTGAKNTTGTPLANNYVWTFTTGVLVAPAVISTSPLNNDTGVVLNKVVTATFSVPMDPATLTAATFTLKNGVNTVAGVITYAGSTASFTPSSALAPNTTYTATITTGAKNVPGTPLANNFVWTFRTISVPAPSVVSTDPLNNATAVVLNKVVTATFSVPMDPLTLTAATFTLKQGVTSIAGVVTYSGSTASFTPSSPLLANTVYTATITTGAKNVPGVALLANYAWVFTTAAALAPTVLSTDPLNNATAVALNKVVTATFSVAMDPLTLTAATFTLKQGVTSVAGVVTYAGTTASFTPSSPLLSNTVYTATITTGAKNVPGTPLAANYVWTFTTVLVVAPTVLSTDPLNNATAVALNKVVTATFSVPMDPLTLTAATFTLKQGVTSIAGVVSYAGSTASFTPSSPLLSSTVYTATITTGAKNVPGTPLASNYVWTFTTLVIPPPTVLSVDPLNLATGVALNKVISANFSTAMDPLTITSSSFTLVSSGGASVAGAVSYSGTTATFTPSGGLLSDSTYTATITTLAKNVSGIPMASDYSWTFSTLSHKGPIAPSLNSVARFGIIAGVGVSNDAGFSVINNMDVGISPGALSSVTGFPPAVINNGAIYAADAGGAITAMLIQAQTDLTNAYNFAAAATLPAPALAPADLGGKTLAPGIYYSTSTLLLQNGDLTLDAQGDANAVWIFQVASSFTSVGIGPYPSSTGGNVILAGGAQAKNVYWQVGSSATIGDYTSFYGNILAFTSITMNTGATATGRMLARNGSVVMTSTNTITKP